MDGDETERGGHDMEPMVGSSCMWVLMQSSDPLLLPIYPLISMWLSWKVTCTTLQNAGGVISCVSRGGNELE